MKVYVVEDSAVFLGRLLSLLAEFDGVEVVGHAATAAEAVQAVADLRPDLLLLDLQLSEGSGLEVLRALKADPEPRVAVLTCHPPPPFRRPCEKAGADWLLDKAEAFDELTDLLTDLLAERGRR